MGGVSRYFAKVSGSGVNLTLLIEGGFQGVLLQPNEAIMDVRAGSTL